MSNDDLEMDSRPARRPSRLWERADEIARRLREGYSYAQIAGALSRAGHPVSARWLRRWCRQHLGRVYPTAASTPASAPLDAASSPAVQVDSGQRIPPEKPSPSLADAYGPEPVDPLGDLRPSASRRKK